MIKKKPIPDNKEKLEDALEQVIRTIDQELALACGDLYEDVDIYQLGIDLPLPSYGDQ